MATKEEDFKERFVAVVQDLRGSAGKDPEAMYLIGSLATRLIDSARQPSWAAYKANMSPELYGRLLTDFEKKGNAFHNEGKPKHAYAIQALAVSVIAKTQTDPEVRSGDGLLDEMIGLLIGAYRKARKASPEPN